MSSHVFLIDQKKHIRPLQRTGFGAEQQLDSYVESYPELLSTALSTPEHPLRLLLIETQAAIDDVQGGLPSRWAADLLFFDQEGVLTIVEDKLSTNPELRRQVVGQMIEYSANLVNSLTVDGLRERLSGTHDDPDGALLDLLGDPNDDIEDVASTFWSGVQRNLKAGAIRMIFVADRLPRQLRQSIEFLNEYMSPMEILGVEVARMQDRSDSGEAIEVMVTSVVGRTERASMAKSAGTPGRATNTPVPRDEFLSEFNATADNSASGTGLLRLAGELFNLEDLFAFDTYRTPNARARCVVMSKSDRCRLLILDTDLARTRRRAGAAYRQWKWPEDLVVALSELLGFKPGPLAREITEWCGHSKENSERLLAWLKRVAQRPTEV